MVSLYVYNASTTGYTTNKYSNFGADKSYNILILNDLHEFLWINMRCCVNYLYKHLNLGM